LDGQTVRILHPGFLSREGGPDFRGAVVQFGDAPPRSGDIEVDMHANGWRAHGHDRNSAFANVILHVTWDGDQQATYTPPALVIGSLLDAPVGELGFWLNSEGAEMLPENLLGKCSVPLKDLPAGKLSELLHEAGQIRFRAKAAQFQARARQVGWEQTLWEGIFRALGYKHNAWPMQCLAEHRERWQTQSLALPELQARLLGISGLLPGELTRAQRVADGYLRCVWDQWWREREEFSECVLPRTLWRFHGQRPANHPQRRLALAAHWLSAGKLPAKLEHWCAATFPDECLATSLFETLQIEPDDFWSWHWTIRSPRLAKPQPLLGAARVTDLAVNVILPWLWVRAVEGKNQELQASIQHRFDIWPAAEDNSVLRLGRQRLLGTHLKRMLRTAAEQQGLIQITRDFCDHSNAVCENCRFPELVQNWRGQQSYSREGVGF
ncbi:MAG: DUF2851 family protein, partial [Akkermansiaceae bacterium]|nr:DUF2851 family protein [Verrucomicrobiales bacterium]